MTPIEQAKRYIAKCPPAISGSGGHNTAFSVAVEVIQGFALTESEAWEVLRPWNQTCQPPWSDKELRHKIAEAMKTEHAKGRGHKIRSTGRFGKGGNPYGPLDSRMSRFASPLSEPSTDGNGSPSVKLKPASYDLSDFTELPDPIEDGARLLIRTLFEPGEGIRIANAKLNEDLHEIPDGSGPCLSREEWLRKLDKVGGKPNGIWSSAKKTGIYIGVNPMKIGGSKDSDVTSFRHVLVEFDEQLSPEEQLNLYRKANLPCSCFIFSGGKSVHAWVKVEARDRQEYDDRVKILFAHFQSAGLKIDEKNKNPSRFSRLPNCVRFDGRQELLAIEGKGENGDDGRIGAESFSAWLGEIQTEGIGELIRPDDLDGYDDSATDDILIGSRRERDGKVEIDAWLCQCEPAILNGASGIGKSSLVYQMGISWAVGQKIFGIAPQRPLRVLVIQAENSKRYLKRVQASLLAALQIGAFSEADALYRKNFAFVHDATHTQFQFVENFRKWTDRFHPDLVIVDPLLAYCPTISKIEDCSRFCREWMQPVLDASKCAVLFVHHTGKTSTDPKSRKGWNLTDFSYAGLGSSDLPNWVRASMTLDQAGEGNFRLMFTKRTWESGATHPDETPTNTVWLRHAERGKGVYWVQAQPAEEEESDAADAKEKKLTIPEQIAQKINTASFLAACPKNGEGEREIIRRLSSWLKSKECKEKLKKLPSDTTIRSALALMLENGKLEWVNDTYMKGSNA